MLAGALALRSGNGLALAAPIPSLKLEAEAGQLAGGCISAWKSPTNVMEQLPSKGQSPPWINDTKSSKISSPKSNRIGDGINSAGIAVSSSTWIAPLMLESSTGKYLVSILQSNTHLFDKAVTHELELLAAEGKAALEEAPKVSGRLSTLYRHRIYSDFTVFRCIRARTAPNAGNNIEQADMTLKSDTSMLLIRRIEALKARERSLALTELTYAMVVQRFVEAGISLAPPFSNEQQNPTIPSPSLERQLEAVHSREALKMIKHHLYSVIKLKKGIPLEYSEATMVELGRFRAGELYADSIAYGYFLRRVDKRYQLETKLKASMIQSDQRDNASAAAQNLSSTRHSQTVVGSGLNRFKGTSDLPGDEELDPRLRSLRAYVAALDHQLLLECAAFRSKESLDVMQKQTEALFGRPEAQMKSDTAACIQLTCLQLKLVVLEAVAFGSFLWDVEQHVESKCTLHPPSRC